MAIEKIHGPEFLGDEAFGPRYKAFTLQNILSIPQVQEYCSEDQIHEMAVVGHVLPFKTNNYVVDQLINWENVPNDPIFILNFPQRGMLRPRHFHRMEQAMESTNDKKELLRVANEIRMELNPQPAGQKTHNVPTVDGEPIAGMQHKYRETVLFFPSQGQTCHAYCTFCFRWPQFTGLNELKFASREAEKLFRYVQQHPEVTDVLFTGGDPMVMREKMLRQYLQPFIDGKLPHLKTIRIGSKSLSYWPGKYTTDRETQDILQLFEEVNEAGIHLAFMAHFNHPQELRTGILREAIEAIRGTRAQIRTQSPLLKHINDDPDDWARMWRTQVDLGMVPYYMFIARDTGARQYFELPLVKAWEIFHQAYKRVSGVCRTVRGPSMSALPGKVHVVGPAMMGEQKVLVLRFLQGRNPDWVTRPFFAKYDEAATWLDDLRPAFAEKFFYTDELDQMLSNRDLFEEDYPEGTAFVPSD